MNEEDNVKVTFSIEGKEESVARLIKAFGNFTVSQNNGNLQDYSVEKQIPLIENDHVDVQAKQLPAPRKQSQHKFVKEVLKNCENCGEGLPEDRCRYCKNCAFVSDTDDEAMRRYGKEIYSKGKLRKMGKL